MTDQHRATDSEWYCLKARTCGDKADMVAYSCILELRDRIEALEAAELHPHHGDTMTTDWKALCAELVNSWIEGRDIVGPMHRACTALAQPETPSRLHHCPTHGQQPDNAWGRPECVREMRQQLAQPEPEGPTVMEIIALADEIEAEGLGQVDLVRRALTRWGSALPTPQP